MMWKETNNIKLFSLKIISLLNSETLVNVTKKININKYLAGIFKRFLCYEIIII